MAFFVSNPFGGGPSPMSNPETSHNNMAAPELHEHAVKNEFHDIPPRLPLRFENLVDAQRSTVVDVSLIPPSERMAGQTMEGMLGVAEQEVVDVQKSLFTQMEYDAAHSNMVTVGGASVGLEVAL